MPRAKKSQKDEILLQNIRKEVDELLDQSKPMKKEEKKTSKSIEKLQEELDRIEKEQNKSKTVTQQLDEEIKNDYIQKRIVIKRRRISRSFMSWLFSNREI